MAKNKFSNSLRAKYHWELEKEGRVGIIYSKWKWLIQDH